MTDRRDLTVLLLMMTSLFVIGLFGYLLLPMVLIFAAVLAVPLVAFWLGVRLFRLLDSSGDVPVDAEEVEVVVNEKEGRSPMAYQFEGEWAEAPMQAHQEELETIDRERLPPLLVQLPSDSIHQMKFFENKGKWLFSFTSKSMLAEFYASGYGDSPMAAYAIGEQILQRQIREWHHMRDSGEKYVGRSLAPAPSEFHHGRPATVLIVDDDLDAAQATATVFKQMGCKTLISTGSDDTHRTIAFGDVDFIVLDWILGDSKRGSQVVEKAAKIIQNISDLRDKFHRDRPKVVTYSVLRSSQIDLPKSEYFYHVDHWQKPIRYDELALRTSELLAASGY